MEVQLDQGLPVFPWRESLKIQSEPAGMGLEVTGGSGGTFSAWFPELPHLLGNGGNAAFPSPSKIGVLCLWILLKFILPGETHSMPWAMDQILLGS